VSGTFYREFGGKTVKKRFLTPFQREPSIEPRASTLPIVPHASMVADVLVPSGARGGGGVQLSPAEMLALIDPATKRCQEPFIENLEEVTAVWARFACDRFVISPWAL
jgi:hypothetical protein